MDWQQEFQRWVSSPALTSEQRQDLEQMAEPVRRANFGSRLHFGTAGLRGVMALGPACINTFTLGQAVTAFGRWLLDADSAARQDGVCICYDARHGSDALAELAARCLSALGLPVHLFTQPRPTPELSFAVGHLGAAGGLNITASHNTAEYNGCKFYRRGGAQLTDPQCDQVAAQMEGLPLLAAPPAGDPALIHPLAQALDEAYCQAICQGLPQPPAAVPWAGKLRIVYTPLHGVGGLLLPGLLARCGFTQLFAVNAQMEPDGAFPTVASPNPEDPAAFALALEEARRVDAHLIIATDPDADRVAFQVKHGGAYRPLSGHQTGCLLADFLLTAHGAMGCLPASPFLVKSLVTTQLARRVAESHGAACYETFTGFKHMSGLAQQLEQEGKGHCILAFEEAIGCMIGSHARDKDGLAAALAMCQLAACCLAEGQTVWNALEDLFRRCGQYREDACQRVYPGPEGNLRRQQVMERLRQKPPASLDGLPLVAIRDYLEGFRWEIAANSRQSLPLSGENMIYYEIAGGTALAIRPSGTEPKIKCYLLAHGSTVQACEQVLQHLRRAVPALLGPQD